MAISWKYSMQHVKKYFYGIKNNNFSDGTRLTLGPQSAVRITIMQIFDFYLWTFLFHQKAKISIFQMVFVVNFGNAIKEKKYE